MELNDPLVTQMQYTLSGKQGFFKKITLKTKAKDNEDNSDKLFPLKQHLRSDSNKVMDVNKYGGYSDMITPYFMLVKSEGKKGKHIYSLESIPTIYLKSFKKKEEDTINYLSCKNKLKNPVVISDKLLMRTIVKIPYFKNDSNLSLVKLGTSGRTGNNIIYINLSELILPIEWKNYYRKISNLLGTNVSSTKPKDLSKYTEQMKNDPTSTLVDGSNKVEHDKNNRFFSYLINNVINKPIFEGLPKTSCSFIKLESKYDEFCSLNTLEQAKIIATIIKLLSCKSVQGCKLSNLSGLPSSLGGVISNKALTEGTIILKESSCGLKENIIFVVPND